MKKRRQQTKLAPTRIKRRRLALAALAIVALAGAVALSLYSWRPRVDRDPTEFGPKRFLQLANVRVDRVEPGFRLLAEGTTNLPDGVRIHVEILSTESIFSDETTCRAGRFVLERRETSRAVSSGRFVVSAVFALEEQSEASRRELHYQPRRLEARAALEIAEGNETGELRSQWTALIARANSASDAASVAQVASDVAGFEQRLWISRLRPATQHLRRSLEGAGARVPLDLAELRRQVVKAEILASF